MKTMTEMFPKSVTELFPQVQQAPELVKKAVDEQVSRFESLSNEAAQFEAKLLENANRMVDESAKQMKAGLAQAVSLSAEYRRLSLELTQKLFSVLTPRA